jgi:adenylosuccinate lyase
MIINDPDFMITKEEMDKIMEPENFTGRSSQQVEEFLANYINPIIEENKDILGEGYEMKN